MSTATLHAGETVHFSLEVANVGTLGFGGVTVLVFIELGNSMYLPRDQAVVSLAPGETTDVSVDWDLPPEFVNKDVRIVALADSQNVLAEPDEDNNRWDFGVVRIQPTVPFACQGSALVYDVLSGESYECFDIRESTLADVTQAVSPTTARLLLYGSYAVLDCPVALLETCYGRAEFVNDVQHEFQTAWVGSPAAISFEGSEGVNPWNLVYIAAVPDVGAMCDVGADACAGGFRIAMPEGDLEPSPQTVTVIVEGSTTYMFRQDFPADCRALGLHEYQHIIDGNLLQFHPGWFEEMLARLFAEHRWFLPGLCPGVSFVDMYKTIDGGPPIPLAEPPDMRVINSELPLDDFGTFYAAGNPCREAIIMTMNRDASSGGSGYLQTLFNLMRTKPIAANAQIASVLLLADGGDFDAAARLETCLSEPFADVAITYATMSPSMPDAADTMSFQLWIENLGTVPVSDVPVSVALDVGGVTTVKPTLPTVTLTPGETVMVPFEWGLWLELADKDVRFLAAVDNSNAVDESNEMNNVWDFGVVHVAPAAGAAIQGR